MPQYFGQLPTIEPAWRRISPVTDILQEGNTIAIRQDRSIVSISILAPNLVRVRYNPTGELLPRREWSVTKDDSEWSTPRFSLEDGETEITITTEAIRVHIQKNPFKIQFFTLKGEKFAADMDAGLAHRTGSVGGWKIIEPDEHYYGFGERTGLLNKLGEIKTNWTVEALDYNTLTDEMYQAIPFYMGLRPGVYYGLYLNSTYWSRFDVGSSEMGCLKILTRAPELDYYVIHGSEPGEILRTYSELTGKMPLPPRWSLGFHQSRWGYDSEELILELTEQFRQHRIPCDVIHLDIDYMRGFRVFTWSEKRFPHPEKLLKEIEAKGFKIVTIVDPGVKYEPEADYPVFDEGIEKDCFIRKANGQLFHGYVWPDKAVFPDFLRSDVREWWGGWHEVLTRAGVAGIWNDMNEPSMTDRPFGDGGDNIWFPLDASHHEETHNLYGLMMARASHEAMLKLRPDRRSFILTRSGFAGIQKYSSVWMGDNQATWEHLEQSLPTLCNMGLSGVPFVGCDIGGFAGNTTAELFARWMQVGILYPLARAHSSMGTIRREPWVYGERIENICREYIGLRYRLIPYLYSLFYGASTTGCPILRPLIYQYPEDIEVYEIHDQVLLGSHIMAAPIYHPGQKARSVYLPAGIWYDWHTGERLEGGRYILAHAPLEIMPLYVKAGAIIPLYPILPNLDTVPDTLTLKIYPGKGQFDLYEDDGESFDFKVGIAAITRYSVDLDGDRVIVDISPRRGDYRPPEREVIIEIIGREEIRFPDDGGAKRYGV